MMEFLTDNLKSYGKFSKVWKLLGLTGQVYPAYHGLLTLTLNIAWFVENSRFAIEGGGPGLRGPPRVVPACR